MNGRGGRMGAFACTTLTVGACIGSAIFSVSGMTVFMAGGSAILSWLFAAAIFCGYGMILTELAVRYPDSGGIYIFPRRAFHGRAGKVLGFAGAWGYVISNLIAIAFSAIYVGVYLSAGFPELNSGGLTPTVWSLMALAVSAAIILCGGRRSQFMQTAIVVMLLSALLLFCFLAFMPSNFHRENFSGFFDSGSSGSAGFISAVPIAMVAYGGCVVIAFLASEVRNPNRNIPRSLFLGLGIVAAVYAAVIAAIIGTLPMNVMKDDPAQRLVPLFASVSCGSLSGYGWMSRTVSGAGVLALVSTIIALMRVNARAVQAIAAEGFVPPLFYKESSRGVPSAATILIVLPSAFLCFFPQWTSSMITLGAVLNIICMTICCSALIRSRRDEPRTRGFRAPAGVILPLLVMTLFWACYIPEVAGGGWKMWAFTAAVYAAGAAVYVLGNKGTRLSGRVVCGKGHGHRHGMPTANLKPFEGQTLPHNGVWEVRVFTRGGVYTGICNVGLRPTDDDRDEISVETLILDFDYDIYGETMTIRFKRYIRPTRKFADLDELKRQIDLDIMNIKKQ